MHIFVAVLFENVRHPGAGSFVRSSTISDDHSIAWNISEMLLNLIGGNTNGDRKFCFCFSPGFRISRSYEKYVFTSIEPTAQVFDADSAGHIRAPPESGRNLTADWDGTVAGELRI